MTKRTGVFVCHCGTNIAATVDVRKLAKEMGKETDVVFSEDYLYMCSEPGQATVINAIRDNALDSVVVACCSPNLHEKTFRDVTELSGLNKFQCEIANIREQCSWVHKNKAEGTEKAIKITRSAVKRVSRNESLTPSRVSVTRKVLVVGGGIAGIQASLDMAASGLEVILVEKEPTIGGNMLKLSETFPTLDCSQCILSPKMVEVSKNKRIKLLVKSEVQHVSGFVGNFKVKILKKPTYVNAEMCKLCDQCTAVCPVVVANEYDLGLTGRRAIFIPFAQSIPATYYLDEETCLGLNPIICGKCAEPDVCEPQAINYDMRPEIIEEDVGAIVVATGFELYGKEHLAEYGYGKYPDVLDGLQFERLCSASGATGGHILRPSDHRVPKQIVFIQCVGSRDPDKHCSYCSKVCCMYTAKHAMLYKHHVPDGKAYIFYIDIRSGGKGYEEFIQRAIDNDHVMYLRGKVSDLYEEEGKIKVRGVDTLSGQMIEIDADMVVLAVAMVPTKGTKEMAKILKIGIDKDGFLAESHPKLKPVESVTAGVFLAGAGQSPKDIPETVAQASAAAGKVMILLSQETLETDPSVARVTLDLCTGCAMCVQACPFEAIGIVAGKAKVNEVLCEGCGTCTATCLRAAIEVKNNTPLQIYDMISAALGG
ncbi:MAG: disulfide reductase [Rhodospirillales bacterium RIFCSPLOWO2_12_FULL_58_28]|nr:MAG: disulfide reductase [Rhodospirillales bacterium RIFCSPLOWO2_02_FULL_58_16]OHC78512.1 MAG: disulfide reductase [Rhodospirillales bacterium RIFCSPLOWO2_12_FULL_58_28]